MAKTVEQLKQSLARLDAEIAKEQAIVSRRDPVTEHYHLGMVGGSGNPRKLAALAKRKDRLMDASIDAAVRINDLNLKRAGIVRQIDAIEKAPERAAASLTHEERLRAMPVGAKVRSALYGEAILVRHNAKTATIETPSGFRTTQKYQWLKAAN